jgi:hypothetical protein
MSKKHRDIDAINADMQAAAEAYAEAVKTKPAHKVQEFVDTIKQLRQEQADCISRGANPCGCGKAPLGMVKTPSYVDGNGIKTKPVYEVGCVYCPQYLIETPEGDRRRSVSARGYSPEEAVANWNTEEWVIDTRFDRPPIDAAVGGLTKGRKIARFDTDERGNETIRYELAE